MSEENEVENGNGISADDVKAEYLDYLDKVSESGVMVMYDGRRKLMKKFGISSELASLAVTMWIEKHG